MSKLTMANAHTFIPGIDNGIILHRSAFTPDKEMTDFYTRTPECVTFDINKILEKGNASAMIVKGKFVRPISNLGRDASGNPVRVTNVASRREHLTAEAKHGKDAENYPTQNIFLVISQVANHSGMTLPKYHLVIESEDEKNPIVLKLDVWTYGDKNFNIEVGLDGFRNNTVDNRVRLDEVTGNNFGNVVGLIATALSLAGIPIASSTGILFASRKAHVDSRNQARQTKPNTSRMTSVAKPETEEDEEEIKDPFVAMAVSNA